MTDVAGRNWAGNIEYSAAALAQPTTTAELAEALRGADRVRALGSRHSFNRIADTPGLLVSVAGLPAAVRIDEERRTAQVSAGMRYGDVATALEAQGWALPNLASLPHISVAGAVSTGTHGSGDLIGSLAASVAGVTLMTVDGDLRDLRRGHPDFEGVVVSLGALGIAVEVELDIVPTFEIAQTVYEGLPLDAVLADLEAVTGLGYSTSLFTTWTDPDTIDQLWVKARTDAAFPPPPSVLGALPAPEDRHPLPGVSAVNCTRQQGVAGPWLDRLPHFRMGFQPSSGEELQSEFIVPRHHAVGAIRAIRALSHRIAPLIHVAEMRTVARDDLWLSPAYGTDAICLHFTWLPDVAGVEALLPDIESALTPFEARPHWGKIFLRRDVSHLYPRWDDFARLRAEWDPRGVLVNPFLASLGL